MNSKISKLVNPSSLYVLINIFVSAVGFVRSFLFMHWLDNSELGIISLVQTVMLFLSLFQIGLVNGGYRIFALDRADQQRKINNVLFSYFAMLSAIVLVAWSVLAISGNRIIIDNWLMLAALVCGVVTLITNWLTNTLIGKRLIRDINRINLISGIATLVSMPFIWLWGMTGAVIVLFAQPIMFVGITLFSHQELRPSAWNFNLKLVKYILSFGFIPFLAGIFVLLNMQIERWSIAEILGTAPLGEFYLVFLYATLFVLVPTSLLSIFFPRAINAYENNRMDLFRSILKKHSVILLVYLSMVVILTFFVMQPVIDWLLPMHSANTIYVYYFLPGLVFLVLSDPMSIVMNSAIRLQPMLYTGLTTVIVTISLITFAKNSGMFNLTNMAIIKSAVNCLSFMIYIVYLTINYKAIFKKKL